MMTPPIATSIEIDLPYPVSANRYWRSFVPRGGSRAIVVLSDEAKAFKAEVAGLMLYAGVRKPFDCRVSITVQLYPERPQDWAKRARRNPMTWDDDVRSIDLDNACKVLIDSLKGVAIVDDSRRYVRRLVLDHMEPDGGGARMRVRIEKQVPEAIPQLELMGAA